MATNCPFDRNVISLQIVTFMHLLKSFILTLSWTWILIWKRKNRKWKDMNIIRRQNLQYLLPTVGCSPPQYERKQNYVQKYLHCSWLTVLRKERTKVWAKLIQDYHKNLQQTWSWWSYQEAVGLVEQHQGRNKQHYLYYELSLPFW